MLKVPRLIPQQMLLMMSIFCHVAPPPRQHDPHHVARPLTLPPPHDSNHIAQPLIKSIFCHVAPPPQQHDPHHVARPLTLPSPHDPNHVAQPLTLLDDHTTNIIIFQRSCQLSMLQDNAATTRRRLSLIL